MNDLQSTVPSTENSSTSSKPTTSRPLSLSTIQCMYRSVDATEQRQRSPPRLMSASTTSRTAQSTTGSTRSPPPPATSSSALPRLETATEAGDPNVNVNSISSHKGRLSLFYSIGKRSFFEPLQQHPTTTSSTTTTATTTSFVPGGRPRPQSSRSPSRNHNNKLSLHASSAREGPPAEAAPLTNGAADERGSEPTRTTTTEKTEPLFVAPTEPMGRRPFSARHPLKGSYVLNRPLSATQQRGHSSSPTGARKPHPPPPSAPSGSRRSSEPSPLTVTELGVEDRVVVGSNSNDKSNSQHVHHQLTVTPPSPQCNGSVAVPQKAKQSEQQPPPASALEFLPAQRSNSDGNSRKAATSPLDADVSLDTSLHEPRGPRSNGSHSSDDDDGDLFVRSPQFLKELSDSMKANHHSNNKPHSAPHAKPDPSIVLTKALPIAASNAVKDYSRLTAQPTRPTPMAETHTLASVPPQQHTSIAVSPLHPSNPVQQRDDRIVEFIETIRDLTPVPIVDEIASSCNIMYSSLISKVSTNTTTEENHAAEPETIGWDQLVPRQSSASSPRRSPNASVAPPMSCSMSASTLVNNATTFSNYQDPWLLVRVYARIRLFVKAWRERRRKVPLGQKRQQLSDLLEEHDSIDWLQAFTVEWRWPGKHHPHTSSSSGALVANSMMGANGTAVNVQHVPPTTSSRNSNTSGTGSCRTPIPPTAPTTLPTVGSKLQDVRTTCANGSYQRGFLHLSTSHMYLSCRSNVESLSIRYCDIVQVEPLAATKGLLVHFQRAASSASLQSSNNNNNKDFRSATLAGGVGAPNSPPLPSSPNGEPVGRMDSVGTEQDRATVAPSVSSRRETTASAVAPDHGGERACRVYIRTPDVAVLALNILEYQSRFLRNFSLTLADRLLLVSNSKKLTVVHFNDVYHLPPFKPVNARGVVGGAGRFHTILSKVRETSNPLVLFSGDFMGPSLMSVITKGKQMVDAMNFLGVHYGVFGNHEFDFGLRVLKEVIHGYTQGKHIYTGSQTTWIMSNMIESDGSPLGGACPYSVCTWNGVRVGLLGLCENWLPQCANLHPSEALYLDIFERGETMAQFLKNEGVHVVLALTHNRYAVDRELSDRCPSIDYILGGHDHKFKNDPKHRILKSGQEFEFLSTMEVTFAPECKPKFRIDCTAVTYDIEDSQYMQGLISRYDAKMAEKLGRTIGKSDLPLDSTEETVRFKEGYLTNFILDVIEEAMETEIAFLGAAAIAGKELKPPGNVTLGDVFGWFPNETKVMTMYLTGKTIQQTLDVMVRELPAEAPSFPHPSKHLSFTINMMKKPPKCEDIHIKGEPIDMTRRYLCAVEDFVGTGKAKYKHVAQDGEAILKEEDAVQVVSLVKNFFLKKRATANDAKDAAALKNVTRVVSSATHIGVDMDMAKSQRFIRSLICELLHCNRASIFLVDHASNELHFVPEGGSEIRMPKHIGLAGHCATSGALLNIHDVYDDPRFNRAIDLKTGYRTKTMLACPVILDGTRCDAVVQAINKDDDQLFDEIDEMMLSVLGEQVGFQLRFQSIFQQAKTILSNSPNEWILDIFRAVTSDVSMDLLGALRSVETHAVSWSRCDRAAAYFIDEASGTVHYLEEGMDDETVVVTAPMSDNCIVALSVERNRPWNIKDPSRMHILSPTETMSCRSILSIPLMTTSQSCVGVVLLQDKPKGFTLDDEGIGDLFGSLAAISVENGYRLSRLLQATTETALPSVPLEPLGRIRVKGGWANVRAMYRRGKVARREAILLRQPVPPMEVFFTNAIAGHGIKSPDGFDSSTSRERRPHRLQEFWAESLGRQDTGTMARSLATGALAPLIPTPDHSACGGDDAGRRGGSPHLCAEPT